MPKVGDLVRVLYPEYAANLRGCLVAFEVEQRWIVKLDTNPLEDPEETLFLSLEESEFEVIYPLEDEEDENLNNLL